MSPMKVRNEIILLYVHRYFCQSSLMTVESKDQYQSNMLADRRLRNSKQLGFICFGILAETCFIGLTASKRSKTMNLETCMSLDTELLQTTIYHLSCESPSHHTGSVRQFTLHSFLVAHKNEAHPSFCVVHPCGEV